MAFIRKVCLKFLSLILLVCTSCSSEEVSHQKNIFGDDDRENIDSSEYPWSAVGRFSSGCTGSLIGKKLVLTAAHCIFDTQTGQMKKGVKSFQPNHRLNGTNRSIDIVRYWLGTKKPTEERKSDWAIVELKDGVGGEFSWLDIGDTGPSITLPITVDIAGYSSDRDGGATLSTHRGCQILKAGDAGRLLTNCEGKSGISGAPLYIYEQDKAKIVAIFVSEYRRGASSSVTVAEYSDDYANVAISAVGFYAVAKTLLESVDVGGQAPELGSIFSQVVAGGNGVDPETPCGGGPCVQTLAQLQLQAEGIYRQSVILVSVSEDIAVFSRRSSYMVMNSYAARIQKSSAQIATVALKLIRNDLSADLYQLISSEMIDLNTASNSLDRYVNDNFQYFSNPRRLESFLRDLKNASIRLRTLVYESNQKNVFTNFKKGDSDE